MTTRQELIDEWRDFRADHEGRIVAATFERRGVEVTSMGVFRSTSSDAIYLIGDDLFDVDDPPLPIRWAAIEVEIVNIDPGFNVAIFTSTDEGNHR